MKTLKELNSKWWWRLFKVAYVFFTGLILLYSTVILYEMIHVYNPRDIGSLVRNISNDNNIKQKLIDCNYDSLANGGEYKVEEFCGLSGVQKYNIDDYFKTKAVVETIFSLESWNIESYYNLTWNVDNNYFRIFNFRPTEYRGIIEYTKIVGYVLIILAGLAIVTIILSKLLYYIILGKFSPDE